MTGKQVAVLAVTGAAGMAGTGALVGGLVAGGGSRLKLNAALMGAGIGAVVGAIFTPLAGWVSEAATNAIGAGQVPRQIMVHSRLAPQGAAGAMGAAPQHQHAATARAAMPA